MLRKTLVTAGVLTAFAATALFATAAPASPGAQWYVIEDVGSGTCNVVDRQAAAGESELGGAFMTLDLARAAMADRPACGHRVQSIDNPL